MAASAAFIVAAIAAASRAVAAAPYADGAPPGFTGGFKEQSCDACHFEAAPNTPPGTLVLAGVPERFIAGERYPLTITLTRPGMKMGGFQLAARFEDGAQAGTLAPESSEAERIKIEKQGTLEYANQRGRGTALVMPDTVRWSLVWTAPASNAPVTFHVAANAANGDEAAAGDYIFTVTTQTR